MFRKILPVALYMMVAIGTACLLTVSTAQAQQPETQDSVSAFEFAAPILVAAAKKKKYKYAPRRSGSGQLTGNGGGASKSIPKGGCCQHVLNACATICNRAGGCTGNGDCSTNPN